MEIINKRIRELRKELRLSQEKFGKILGISKSAICDMEAGRRRVTEAHILLLTNWNQKTISESWLRTGDGSMFRESDFATISESDGYDEWIRAVVAAYLELTPAEREIIQQFLRKLFDRTLPI